LKGSLQNTEQFFRSISSYRPDRRAYIFLVCVAFSTIIWFLIALSKEYTTYIDFPVEYSNAPTDQIITNQLPGHVSLEVSSHGFGLLSYSWFANKTITIDLAHLNVRNRGVTTHSYIVMRDLINDFSEQFESSIELHKDRIFPDTIHVMSSDTMTKKVAVHLDAVLTFEPQHNLSKETQYLPRAVFLHGPKSMLDTMTLISTERLFLPNLKESQSLSVPLLLSDQLGLVTIDQPEVLVTIAVDMFTEREMRVHLKTNEIPPGFSVKLHPEYITVKYAVGLSNFNQVSAKMFRAVVELPDTSELTNSLRLRVELVQTPDFIEVIDYKPKRVEPFIRRIE
jgi:hypothetical protein